MDGILSGLNRAVYDLLPGDGRGVKERTLLEKLGWDPDQLQPVKAWLRERKWIEILRGGVLRRTEREDKLYPGVLHQLREWFWDQVLGSADPRASRHLVRFVGSQGRRKTGGKWSRPDFLMVSLRAYDHLPLPAFDVWSFEVKARGAIHPSCISQVDVASHGAHRAVAIVQIWPDDNENGAMARCIEGAISRGVGLVTFTSADDRATWRLVVPPPRREPGPDATNLLLGQFPTDEAGGLQNWYKTGS